MRGVEMMENSCLVRHSRSKLIECAFFVFLCVTLSQGGDARASAAWPNEPAGWTVITDNPFNSTVQGGWNLIFNMDTNITTDGTAPLSPSNVVQFRYATGFTGGGSPGKVYFELGPYNVHEFFSGYWWKASGPTWQGHPSNINKHLFYDSQGSGSVVPEMWGLNGPFQLVIAFSGTTIDNTHLNGPTASFGGPGSGIFYNNVGNAALALGQWYKVEIYFKQSTSPTSRNGILKVWLNGTLVINHTTINSGQGAFTEIGISPTWGGAGATKTQTDLFWFDHLHFSSPNATSSRDITPPQAPTALVVQ